MIYQIPYQITLGILYIRLGNEPSPVVTDLMDQILQSDGSNNLIIYVCSLNTQTLIKPMENYQNIRIECRDQRKGWKALVIWYSGPKTGFRSNLEWRKCIKNLVKVKEMNFCLPACCQWPFSTTHLKSRNAWKALGKLYKTWHFRPCPIREMTQNDQIPWGKVVFVQPECSQVT